MKNFRILSDIMSGNPWLIHPAYARQQMSFIEGLLKGEVPAQEREPPPVCLLTASGSQRVVEGGFSSQDIQEGSYAVINISGPITKTGGWCSYGTKHFSHWLSQAENNPNIAGIIFKFDTPGGSPDGTASFAQQIRDAKKPTIAFIDDGMCCSAGYWMAAACDEIISSHKINMVGSIGVYVSLMKKIKTKHTSFEVVEVYADQSPEKNKAYREAVKGNTEVLRQELLNPLAQTFIDSIKEYRGNKFSDNPKLFQGITPLSDTALKEGLIDHIGNFDFAMERMQSLINSNVNNQSNLNTNTMSTPKEKPNFWQQMKTMIAQQEAQEQDTAPTAEQQLAAANEKIQELTSSQANTAAQLEEVNRQKTALEAENTALSKQVTELTAARDQWKQKAEELGNQPDGKTATPKREGDNQANTEVQPLAEDFRYATEVMNELYEIDF